MLVWRLERPLWFINRRGGPAGSDSCDNKSNGGVWTSSRSPLVLSDWGSRRVRAAGIPASCLARTQTGFRQKETFFKHYPQLSVLALFFSSFLHPFFFPSLSLIFSSLKYVREACAEQTWGVNSRDQRKPNVRNNGWICLLLSILHLRSPPPLLVSPCEPAGFGQLSGWGAQRIPWQRSTLTDGRRAETDFGFGCSSGISRTFLGLVSQCILLFQSYLIRKGL